MLTPHPHQARKAAADAEAAALRARLTALQEAAAPVATTPVRGGTPAAERLVDCSERLDILAGLQVSFGGGGGGECGWWTTTRGWTP